MTQEEAKKDSLRTHMNYELLVSQECFHRCVGSLSSKTLTSDEELCITNCALKYSEARPMLHKKYFEKFKANFVVKDTKK